jgi:ribosomal protein L37AE/L43A
MVSVVQKPPAPWLDTGEYSGHGLQTQAAHLPKGMAMTKDEVVVSGPIAQRQAAAGRELIEEHVSAEILNSEQFKCPKCQNATLNVEGNVQAPMIGIVENGEMKSSTVNDEVQRIEISAFDCSHCRIHYVVKPVEVINLETELFKLRDLYKQATGIDPFGTGQPC